MKVFFLMNVKVKKIARCTYRVTFSKREVFTVIIPNFWLELGDEDMERSIAIAIASERLEYID